VLEFKGVPILPVPHQLSAVGQAQVGLAAAHHGLDSTNGLEFPALLLEHRAQPRRHLHAALITKRGVRAGRVPLPRTHYRGRLLGDVMPSDRLRERTAGATRWSTAPASGRR
jgi:hypothetical protein